MCVTDNGQLNMFILFNIIKCFDKIDFTPKQLHCHEEKLKVIIITNNTLLKSYKSCTQNFSKIFIKRKRQYQYKNSGKTPLEFEIPRNHIEL